MSKIIDANHFSCYQSQIDKLQKKSFISLKNLYKTSKGELYWSNNFKLQRYNNSEIGTNDAVCTNKYFNFLEPNTSILYIHEACQQIIKFTKNDINFKICNISENVSYFILQDLNDFNLKAIQIKIRLSYSNNVSDMHFEGMRDCSFHSQHLDQSIRQIIDIYQKYCKARLTCSFS